MSQPFFVVVPTPVDDTNFVSSTVPENDFPEYNAATTYNIGDRVIVTTGYHMIYESLTDANTGNFPPDSPLNWVEVSPTNAWAAFDQSGGTLTTTTSPLEFVVTGDRITSMGFLEVQAVTIRIQANNAIEGLYYDQTYTLEDRALVANWFDYFFTPIDRQRELIITDIPPISESTYTITLESDGQIELGTFVKGQSSQIGFTEFGVRVGIIDYSKKEVDQFGRAQIIRRNFSKRVNCTVWVDRANTDGVARLLSDLRAQVVLWVAAPNQFEATTVFGFYRDFDVSIEYPTQSLCNLEIEGISQ